MFAGKFVGSEAGGCAPVGAGSFIAGRGGSSGMAGTAGILFFAVIVAAGELAFAEFEAPAGAAEFCGGVSGAVDGHAGAPLSAASDAPFVPVSGGTPSGVWRKLFAAPGRVGTGPSLIFTYKYAPTTTRIVIVTSGRIEPIDRPP
jgi:hypothetical protein